MSESQSRFIPRLESARGIAALTVALFHCIVPFDGTWLQVPSIWELETKRQVLAKLAMIPINGGAAVTFFFVLSGFVLGRSLASKNQLNQRDSWQFAVSRVLRIYPVFAASIVFFVMVYYFARPFLPSLPTFGFADIARELTLIDEKFRANPPLSTAALELVITPLILLAALARKSGRGLLFALFAVTIAMLVVLPSHLQSYYLIWISRYSFMFVLGIWLADVNDLRLSPRAAKFMFVAAMVGLLVPRIWFTYDAAPTLLLEAASSAMVIALLAAGPKSFATFLLHPSVRWLGRISYSFYGFHFLAVVMVLHIFGTAFPVHDPFIASACIAMAAIPISLGLAAISHRYIEVPGVKLGHKLTRAASTDGFILKSSGQSVAAMERFRPSRGYARSEAQRNIPLRQPFPVGSKQASRPKHRGGEISNALETKTDIVLTS